MMSVKEHINRMKCQCWGLLNLQQVDLPRMGACRIFDNNRPVKRQSEN